VSTHGEGYVYAIRDPLTALLFGAPKDDFDLLMDEEEGKVVLWECYPGALRRVYEGKRCSIYEVEETGFLSGQTGWEPEWVCRTPVKVQKETHIPDLYTAVTAAAQQGRCVIHEYSDDKAYRDFLREELSQRVADFGLTKEEMARDPRFRKYFPWLLQGLLP